jgi:hypothetical protein
MAERERPFRLVCLEGAEEQSRDGLWRGLTRDELAAGRGIASPGLLAPPFLGAGDEL